MKKNVLIINHDQREADEIKGRLLSSVSEVICATSMQDAMKYFIKIEFALIILDAHMSAEDDHKFLKLKDKFTQQEFQIRDSSGRRWIQCELCGDIKPESEFGSYGGTNHVNLGVCYKCSRRDK